MGREEGAFARGRAPVRAERWDEGQVQACAGELAELPADTGRVLGTVSVDRPDKPNSRHRAELVKLMVHRTGRGQGLGRRLPTTAEDAAAAAGTTLLHLDTETGSPAELRPTTRYFERLDFQRPGG
ncbi:GNAT family N-acetyltransferase [Streptomyces monashensis]|uniref:GNAT family N-acetyltransferase n=1 Tax=Streptomyces monashensis TaxID=1678012 RepID=UPI003F53F2DC